MAAQVRVSAAWAGSGSNATAVIEGAVAEEKLREAKADLWFDPAALEEDEARLFELRGMARKHRVQPDALAELADALPAKLEALDAGEEGIAALEAKLAAARATYDRAAAALSEARTAAAVRLDAAPDSFLISQQRTVKLHGRASSRLQYLSLSLKV